MGFFGTKWYPLVPCRMEDDDDLTTLNLTRYPLASLQILPLFFSHFGIDFTILFISSIESLIASWVAFFISLRKARFTIVCFIASKSPPAPWLNRSSSSLSL